MNLPAGWYIIGALAELEKSKPNAWRRFGIDLAIWWDAKDWRAHADRCPHRSARLSAGSIESGCLTCPFHGFRFNAQGECTHVPETGRPARLPVRTWPVRAHAGYLWLRWGEPASAGPSWFDAHEAGATLLPDRVAVWPTHFSRCVENQLDYAHLPFVHKNSIGRYATLESRETRKTDAGLHVFLPNGTGFELLFPNAWRLRISDRLGATLAFVPVDDSTTRIYQRGFHRFTKFPLLRQAIAYVIPLLNARILREDERVVTGQQPLDVREARDEVLFPSDATIQAFRAWLGQAAQNPLL